MKFSTSQFLEMLKQEKSYVGRLFTLKRLFALINLFSCFSFLALIYLYHQRSSFATPLALVVASILFGANALYFFYAWRLNRTRLNLEKCWDPVSGAWSRLYFDGILGEEVTRAGRYHYALSLCLIDLDNFRSFNENFGRRKGDLLLQQFTRFVKGNIRSSDLLGRYSDDAFFLLFPHADVVRAEKIISRLWDQAVDKFDCSFRAGVTAFCVGESKAQFLERAQIALEQAKKASHKRIICLVGQNEGQAVLEF